VPEVSEHRAELDGQPLFWRSAPAAAGVAVPPLYLHGVPTSSDDWLPFLEETGGLAPDLPGFGRSSKRGDLDYTMDGYDRFVERFLDRVGAERVQLLVHDWGAVGLLWAQRFPARVQRLVVMAAVPFLPGYRWHRTARAWRTRGLGELVMGMTTRFTFKQAGREARAGRAPFPDAFVDAVMAHFDQGTQRAILRLYRASPEERLARAGDHLDRLACPALVVVPDRDPYIPARFGDAYAAALPAARAVHLPDAGHWPWLDRPDVVDAVAAFFAGRELPAAFAA
jgi:pimeloyl-ACP methyl ester carboxylesterase